MTHPYAGLDSHHFWRSSISDADAHRVDPVVRRKFVIGREERVATAGSCFAQHLARRLSTAGFHYFVPESGDGLDSAGRAASGFGVFSARYGNVYTTRQLLQLFDEAFGHRPKSEPPWQREDGRWVDPFRPRVEARGFADAGAVAADRERHLGFVRQVFLEADVFVFTLGLTECWVSRASGDVLPLAPGVAGGTYDPSLHAFVNFPVGDVLADLDAFLGRLKAVNAGVRVLLTVSPVPLAATYEDRHVLVSNTYSKSVLRVAAQMAADARDWVDYFPSFEIVTGSFNMGRYYDDDCREVSAIGVGHVMRCFLDHYAADGDRVVARHAAAATDPAARTPEDAAWRPERVVCDEDEIAAVSMRALGK